MVHSLIEMEKLDDCNYEYLMMLQPTTPFRTFKNINDSLNLIKESKKIDSVISVVDVQGNHPARMKFVEDGFLIDPTFVKKLKIKIDRSLKNVYKKRCYLLKQEGIYFKTFF